MPQTFREDQITSRATFNPDQITDRDTFSPDQITDIDEPSFLSKSGSAIGSALTKFIAEPAKEQFEASVDLFNQPSRTPEDIGAQAQREFNEAEGFLGKAGAIGKSGLTAAFESVRKPLAVAGATLGPIFAPFERPLENLGFAAFNFMKELSAADSVFARQLTLGLPSFNDFPETRESISKLTEVTGPNRPTTGSPLGDFVVSMLVAFIPIERALTMGKALSKLGTKADIVREVRAELGQEAAVAINKKLPSNLEAIGRGVETLETPGGGVFKPGAFADAAETTVPTSPVVPDVLGAGAATPLSPSARTPSLDVGAAQRLRAAREPAPFTATGELPAPKLLGPGPLVPGGVRTSIAERGRGFAQEDITVANIAAGRDGGLPPQVRADVVAPGARTKLKAAGEAASPRVINEGVSELKEAVPFLTARTRSGGVLADDGYLRRVRIGARQQSTFLNDPTRMAKLEQGIAIQSAPKTPLPDTPDAVIPLEISGGQFAILRKAASNRGVDLDAFSKQHFGPNRTAPRTRKELKFTEDAFKAMDDNPPTPKKPPSSGDGGPPINGGAVGEEPSYTYNPAKLVPSDFAAPKTGGLLPSMLNELRKKRNGPTARRTADSIDHMLNRAERRMGNANADLDIAVRGMNADDLDHMRRIQDFGEIPRSQRFADAITAMKGEGDHPQIAIQDAIRLEMEVPDIHGGMRPIGEIENFFPRQIDTDLMMKDIDELAQLLLKNSDEISDIGQAREVVKGFATRYGTRKASSIDFGREFLNLPDRYYNTNYIDAWKIYYRKTFRRLEEVELFGQKGPRDPKYQAIASAIEAEGGDSSTLLKVYELLTGTGPEIRFRQNASRFARTLNMPKLALAQVINLSQFTLTTMRTNTRSFVEAMVKLTTRKGRAAARELNQRAGNSADVIGAELSRQLVGDADFSRKFMEIIGFGLTERANNIMGSAIGRVYAESTARKYFRNVTKGRIRSGSLQSQSGLATELRRLGIDPEDVIRQKAILNGDQIQRAAQQVVIDSQRFGRTASQNLFTVSPEGKVLLQFKSFAIGATRLIKNETFRQIRKNPVRFVENMGKLAFLFPAIGRVFKVAREGVIKPGIDAALSALGVDVDVERDSIESIISGQGREDIVDVKLTELILDAFDVAGTPIGQAEAEILASFISDAAYVGGLGIAMDGWTAAQFGAIGVAKFFAGPTGSGVISAGQLLGGNINPALEEIRRNIPVIGSSLPKIRVGQKDRRRGRSSRPSR